MKFLLMTSHHDIHTKINVKPEVIAGIQTRNGIPHDKCNLRGIAHARTNKKDDIFMQRVERGKGLVQNPDCTRPELTQP